MPSGHWSTRSDLNFRYYSAERGYWMYAQVMEQIQEENGVRYDGRRIRLMPFLGISVSRDGRKSQTISSDVAVIDLNQALGFSTGPEGEALKVKHVRLEPNVLIHDNKGTPNDLKDDMTVGPLTYLEFDEPTQQISTDSHVVITDAEMVTSGDGMLIQLRQNEVSIPGSSSGFDGVERLELLKNVHVLLHDAGKSGIIPGTKEPHQPGKRPVEAKIEVTQVPNQKAQTPVENQPTPLNLTCDSKMRVFPAKPRLSVVVGPPAPPDPTFVQFERNVVVLRGQIDDQPGQLTCDNLKLTLVPAHEPALSRTTPVMQIRNPETARSAFDSEPQSGLVATNSDNLLPQREVRANGDASADDDTVDASNTSSPDEPRAAEKGGLFGSLTLQRMHATGHAVWLYLPLEGVKLKCNELIHVRRAPEKPDMTYFCGDLNRPLKLEKTDVVQDVDSPDHGKIKSVTNIWSIDAALYDKGYGFDSADIVANGPGRLETRPDRGQPIERIAIWQDKLEVQNDVASDGKIKQKIILLTGKRPCFIDNSRGSSIDSAELIKVLLIPKATQTPQDLLTAKETNSGDGGFDIKRLLAFRDVHLLATGKTLTARRFLDAEFVQSSPVVVPADKSGLVPVAVAPVQPSDTESDPNENASNQAQPENQVAARDQTAKSPPELPMVGSADRIWVKIEMIMMSPGQTPTSVENSQMKTSTTKTSKPNASNGDLDNTQSEIREAWLWGSVAVHQDPAEGKTIGQDASGEALYLDNPSKGKAITFVFQRELKEMRALPGPLPPAKVESDDKTITASGGAGIIAMNQTTDQAWVEGPGTLTQITTRVAKSPVDSPGLDPKTAGTLPSGGASSPGVSRSSVPLLPNQNNRPPDQTANVNVSTRAGRALSDKVSSTICFSEGMEFNGQSIDPEGYAAGRADFYGVATAQLEDSLLHAEAGMIAYTDRPVPFAQLGALNKPKSKEPTIDDEAGGNNRTEEGPQLAIIECYRNAIGISRKVDPARPEVLQQQRIEAEELLVYDRRTGNFHIPGKGKVYLYDRSDNSQSESTNPDVSRTPSSQPDVSTRMVTSDRGSKGKVRPIDSHQIMSRDSRQTQIPIAPAGPKTEEYQSLILTQIHFVRGMRGRFGSTGEYDRVEPQWYQFFGDIQLARAKVSSPRSRHNLDKLPDDGLFLTGQTLSVRTEPPQVGSPPSAPARDYVKVWENAYAYSSDKVLQADVITYDSEKDLVYAFGEGGRGVNYAQQIANGQPSSQGLAKAVRFNPKTGAADFIENAAAQLIDKNSGVRPQSATLVDPDFKKKKPPKKGFRIQSNSVERRGFTGS